MIFNESNIIIPQTVEKGQDEILIDKSRSGRVRPWRDKKMKSLKISNALQAIGENERAVRCQDCGSQLSFLQCPDDGHKKLTHANFCRDRLCPMCNWRRSLRLMYEISLVLHEFNKNYPTYRLIFLTLTQKNVLGQTLPAEIKDIMQGWNTLTKQKDFKKSIAGFFRTLELTHNLTLDSWHPHIHALLVVKPSYFSGSYISQARWRQMWQDVLNLDYEPEVRIEAVKNKIEMAKEVGKYLTKDSDLIADNDDETIENVRVLNNALRGKRLVSYGGLLRKTAAQVLKRTEAEDLIHIDDEPHDEKKCPICNGSLLPAVYTWFGNQYKINQKFTLSALSELANESKTAKLLRIK